VLFDVPVDLGELSAARYVEPFSCCSRKSPTTVRGIRSSRTALHGIQAS